MIILFFIQNANLFLTFFSFLSKKKITIFSIIIFGFVFIKNLIIISRLIVTINLDFIKKITKIDLSCDKIYILRKVERLGEKGLDSEKGQLEILGVPIELNKQYINSIVLVTINIKLNILEIGLEQNGKLNIILEQKFTVKNI